MRHPYLVDSVAITPNSYYVVIGSWIMEYDYRRRGVCAGMSLGLGVINCILF